jgi:hypothetical protein
MTINEQGAALSNMYHNAHKGDAVAMINVFGIKYTQEIQEGRYSKKDIAEAADIHLSYATVK